MQAECYEFCRRFRSWPQAWETVSNYPCALARRLGLCRSQASIRSTRVSRAAAYMKSYGTRDFYAQRLFHCRVGLLPYYLRSTDHYTMNIPLEHRFPLLDYRLVELGMKMPVAYLFHDGWTKYVLRRAMASVLPREVLWRKKKMGFPFDFSGYFPRHQAAFEKYLGVLEGSGLGGQGSVDYQVMAKSDPVLLWRMLSVGVWLKNKEFIEG